MQILISDMNKKFNNPVMTKPCQAEFDRLAKQIFYAQDELKELVDATSEYDAIDALGDAAVFLKGFRHMAGAQDDYTVNIALVCNFIDMIKPGSVDDVVLSDYPVHHLHNELTALGMSVGMEEFESILRESGTSMVAASFIQADPNMTLIGQRTLLKDSIGSLVEHAEKAASNGDIAGAMYLTDKALSLIYFVAANCNVDIDKALTSIYDSNMTKFCKDQEELEASIQAYADMGVEVIEDKGTEFPFKVIRSAKEQEVGGKLYSAGKFLKSVSFKEPCFTTESVRCS